MLLSCIVIMLDLFIIMLCVFQSADMIISCFFHIDDSKLTQMVLQRTRGLSTEDKDAEDEE